MKKLFFCFLFAILCTGNLSAQIISTYAGNGSTTFSGDGGAATSAGFVQPWAAATDRFGNLYIVDFWGARVRKVNTAGVISTFAGNGSSGYGGDGGAATMAQLEYPTGIATDTAGNIYIVNENSIRKVNSLGMISTVAGSATAGFSGDGGLATAALLNISYGIAADNSGNIYIADQANNRIRKVNAAGIISTIAGNGILGFGGDGGQATDAELNQPEGIAVDDTGNVYIGDRDNGRVRKVSISGIITTIAGNGTIGYAGDGGPATDAEFSSVIGLCVDHSGNIICADASNNCVRKISTTGMISTIAGNDTMGYSGDGGPATAAEMNQVYSVCMNNAGDLFIVDYSNYRIRKVNGPGTTTVNTVDFSSSLKVYPNPNSGSFSIEIPKSENKITITLSDILGKVIETRIVDGDTGIKEVFNLNYLAPGAYLVKVSSGDSIYREKIVIW